MNWKLIDKKKENQPTKGTYSDWKSLIAEECFYQCVYCSIHEAQFGGIDHFQIDHFKPQKKFPHLKDDILNLFYVCPICNRFKSDDWPGEPDLNSISYIEPSKHNYSQIFQLKENFEIEGKYIAANYMIHRIYLNRAQLILERREFRLRKREIELRSTLNYLIEKVEKLDINTAFEALKKLRVAYDNLLTLEQRKRTISPYKLVDIRKL